MIRGKLIIEYKVRLQEENQSISTELKYKFPTFNAVCYSGHVGQVEDIQLIQDILFPIFVFFGFLPTCRRKRYKTSLTIR